MNYQIRMRGGLVLCWQGWLAGLQIVHEPSGTTLLSGPLPEQATLFGGLLKINRHGLTLLSLEARNGAAPHETGDVLRHVKGRL